MGIGETLSQLNRLDRLSWASDGANWPHREMSRFIEANGLTWHVQHSLCKNADAPTILLLHGTGASSHSWAGVIAQLKDHFHLIAPDLPGHAFTDLPLARQFSTQLSLPGMARGMAALLREMKLTPDIVIGHSAGAAIGVRMCLDDLIAPREIISINGALMPLHGVAGQIFSPMAKLMAATPLVPQLFSWRATSPSVVKRLLESTGSSLNAQSAAIYARLVRNPGHATGALGMMAHWDLVSLARELPKLKVLLHLIAAQNDGTIAPKQSQQVHQLVAGSRFTLLQELGHLAHEEKPELISAIILNSKEYKK
jgi:magnesium chelatase accessory protein